MIKMFKNTFIVSIVMLTVLVIASYAHAAYDWSDSCNSCHKNKSAPGIIPRLKEIIRINSQQKIYLLTIDYKQFIVTSSGGIIKYN